MYGFVCSRNEIIIMIIFVISVCFVETEEYDFVYSRNEIIIIIIVVVVVVVIIIIIIIMIIIIISLCFVITERVWFCCLSVHQTSRWCT